MMGSGLLHQQKETNTVHQLSPFTLPLPGFYPLSIAVFPPGSPASSLESSIRPTKWPFPSFMPLDVPHHEGKVLTHHQLSFLGWTPPLSLLIYLSIFRLLASELISQLNKPLLSFFLTKVFSPTFYLFCQTPVNIAKPNADITCSRKPSLTFSPTTRGLIRAHSNLIQHMFLDQIPTVVISPVILLPTRLRAP